MKDNTIQSIKGFKDKLEHDKNTNPMRENVTQDDVGHTASFLCSNYAKAITGEVIYVDNGNHILGAN